MDEKRSDSERIAQIEMDMAKVLTMLDQLAKASARTVDEVRRCGHVGVSILPGSSQPDNA